jgi:enoyl-CoA hydratase/carnithine racemase
MHMPQIKIEKPSPARWTATFNNPPINLIDMVTIGELQELIAALESDPDVRVVVFRSDDPDFFLAHWDVLADKAKVAAMPPGSHGHAPLGRHTGAVVARAGCLDRRNPWPRARSGK